MTLDAFEICQDGQVSLRWIREGEYHRETRAPGAGLSDLPEETRKEIQSAWTSGLLEQWASDHPADGPQPVDDQRLALLEQIADRRWRAMTAPLDHAGVQFEMITTTTPARLDQYIATLGIEAGVTVSWEIRRGVYEPLTLGQCQSLRHAIARRNRAAYDQAEALSRAAWTAEDAAALGDIDINAGWPE